MKALPEMYALNPQARHTFQAKPKCSVLQVLRNTCQAIGSLASPAPSLKVRVWGNTNTLSVLTAEIPQ